ncbi:MTAP family purine nucleoside phosphorylase [Sporomusa acidovorans]|uniref:S-methyl-5'-thioadenosine phosphorylase n=1 Tax=Sporomusa acidovorans (strain ATCC 49682 / DSM 3132 / Mol) TaxID=1123286 RepID=A0ABZ3IYC5_SPOA4|nr:MTAP family purine nucleoside phosphorylase [Sporomusa acidovorans]OZC22384.1 S-methyl-5'-thioadenosine phosphorylase [Sporomusa acidovorans DSM 3132]SDE47572.1 5'-methylthioadenosine phosphorylase [Sporomusa acidovorans]
MNAIPQASIAIIGGSGTLSMDFPAALARQDVEIIQREMVFDTPYGQTPPLLLFGLGNKKVLTCRMHGWRSGVSRADASRQIFWLFREAGVKKILAEGGVGSVNHLLDTRDVVVASDYIDQSMRKDVGLEGHYLLIMRQALCPHLREELITAAEARPLNRVFRRGVYAVTDGRHFESPAEVATFKGHADIIGQSLCPEVYLAREIGACYAGLYTVVNYGEGVVKDWEHSELSQIFYEDADKIGHILLDAISRLDDKQDCGCADLRKPTLLKKVYGPES